MKQTDTHIILECHECQAEIEIQKSQLRELKNFHCSKCTSIHHFSLDGKTLIYYMYHSSIILKSDCPTCDGGQSGICYGKEAHGE